MTRILVCGDTHMDTSSICNVAIPKAKKNDCKLIVQVGDFGYWEHQEHGKRFLNKISKSLVREGVEMIFIDGNHDNHPLLWSKYPTNENGLVDVRPNLHYVPRGTVYRIGLVTCLFLGGAYSIDKEWRVQEELAQGAFKDQQYEWNADTGEDGLEHTLWWPTELITETDVERSIRHANQDGPIDLMFTHDVPTGLNVPGIHASQKEQFPVSTRNRMMLRQVFDAVQPKMLVHGHYHTRYTDKLPLKAKVSTVETFPDLLDWDYCRVDGLACNGMHGFAVVLDLDSLFLSE